MTDEQKIGTAVPRALEAMPGIAAFGDVPVRLSVEVGSAGLSLSDLLALQPGGLVELDRASDDALDILANGALIARGEVVTVNGRFAVRIVDVAAAASARSFPALERRQ